MNVVVQCPLDDCPWPQRDDGEEGALDGHLATHTPLEWSTALLAERAKVAVLQSALRDVSRETSPVDPRHIELGALVEAHPRAGIAGSVIRGQFVTWIAESPMDRDAIVKLDVDGIPHTFLARRYSFRLVR